MDPVLTAIPECAVSILPEESIQERLKTSKGRHYALDNRHICSADTCSFDVEGDVYVCWYTGAVHTCGRTCTQGARTSAGLACKISGREITTIDGAMEETLNGYKDCLFNRRPLIPSVISDHERIFSECHATVGRVLWGAPESTRNAEQTNRRALQLSMKGLENQIRDHRLNPETSHHPINFFNLYFSMLTRFDEDSERRTDARPERDEGRTTFYAKQCASCHQICKKSSSRARKRKTPPKTEYIALALLYMMREGVLVEHNQIIPRDQWLAKNLPPLKRIDGYGFKKGKYTAAERFIKECLVDLSLFKPLGEIRLGLN